MSKKRDALKDIQIRMAKPRDKPYKPVDGCGLYLFVTPAGGKLWRIDLHNDQGRWNTLRLGAYPQMSLADARNKREEVKKERAAGRDPATVNRILKMAQSAEESTFEVVAREWHAQNLQIWTPRHGERVLKRLCKEVFPSIGTRAVQDLTAWEILDVCKRVEARGFRGTAHRGFKPTDASSATRPRQAGPPTIPRPFFGGPWRHLALAMPTLLRLLFALNRKLLLNLVFVECLFGRHAEVRAEALRRLERTKPAEPRELWREAG